MTDAELHATVAAVWRRESATVVAVTMRLVRDVGLAEEIAQDALVAALEQWPRSGVPGRPGAWLVTTARNRALNALKRARMADAKHETIRHAEPAPEDLDADMDRDVRDDVLRLVFTACHPALSREARVALTLRLVVGLTTEEIARACLVPEPTMAQRLVRAKKALAGAAWEVPREELGERLRSVLEVVYLLFNEGYAATGGDAVVRTDLAAEALRLGELLAELAPAEPEVHGLLALMRLQHSRAAARTDEHGDPVLLADQDRSRWDAGLVTAGLEALGRADGTGPYALQARIAACHARAPSVEGTDWAQIAALYGELARRWPSPVVELNRAVAVARAEGPAAGLALLDRLVGEPALARYPQLHGARGELLERLGRVDEARAEFARAAGLATNERIRRRLLARAGP